MADDDLVRVKLETGVVTSVGRSFAESHDLKILTDSEGNEVPGVGFNGRTPEPEYPDEVTTGAGLLTGKALTKALTDAGLSTTGKVSEKQERLAEHLAAQGQVVDPDNPEPHIDADPDHPGEQ